MMRALVKTAPGAGHVEIRDLPERSPQRDELLIKIKYCGICGTDLHIAQDEFPNDPPVIMGHEYCGTIVEVGEGVQDRWSVGQRVVGELHTGACGECELCQSGKPHICDAKLALGSRYDGAFAEYLTLPAWLAHPIPDGVPWEVAGVTEPFAIAAHCLAERGQISSPRSVLISGAATMGLMSTLWARRLGAQDIIVSGTDLDQDERFPLARAMGADRLVNVQQEDLAQVVMDRTQGRGVDVWVECSGAMAAICSGLDLVKKTGKLIMIGLTGPAMVDLPWNTLLYREIDAHGCFSSPPSSWELALAAEVEEADRLRQLVTAILSLDRWEEGFEMLRRGKGVKILLDLEG
jgi:L-iditol 2-dehydrogenase